MPPFRVSLVSPLLKKKIASSIKGIICEASVSVKAKFDGTNLSTDELNNFIGEMLLFYKGNLTVENILCNKHVFKATLHSDITNPQDADEFSQGYCD